jgi:hypothetical protein
MKLDSRKNIKLLTKSVNVLKNKISNLFKITEDPSLSKELEDCENLLKLLLEKSNKNNTIKK